VIAFRLHRDLGCPWLSSHERAGCR